MFIVFEGTEGSGKTSLINLCYEWLTDEGYPCVISREPGGTALGEQLRSILLSSDSTPLAELLMFAADRAQHVKTFLKPKLAEGNIVLCDRYTYSTIAYQGYGRGLSLSQIVTLNNMSTERLEPDITFWLDVDVEVGLSRKSGLDRIEKEAIAFHQRVREGYQAIHSSGMFFIRLDTSLSLDLVFKEVKSILIPQL